MEEEFIPLYSSDPEEFNLDVMSECFVLSWFLFVTIHSAAARVNVKSLYDFFVQSFPTSCVRRPQDFDQGNWGNLLWKVVKVANKTDRRVKKINGTFGKFYKVKVLPEK